MELRQAQRKQAKIKLALQGPSGSGKTMSSLLLAFGMTGDWSKIAVIDTENSSADLYSHLGEYNVLGLAQPFSPERYMEAIEACEKAGMEVIIIDSLSPEWDGSGGILNIHGNMPGNSFANWNKVTPRHNNFVQKILQSPCHVIGTIRTKQDYVLNDKEGKMVPEKVGLKGITRDGFDYEFTVVFDVNINHQAVASKDRTMLFVDKPSEIITSDHGKKILEWCNSGVSLSEIKARIINAGSIVEVNQLLNDNLEYMNELGPHANRRIEQLNSSFSQPKFSENGIG